MQIVIWSLFFAVALLSVLSVFHLRQQGKRANAREALTGFLAYAVLFLLVSVFRVGVPPLFLILTLLTVLGNCVLGHGAALYLTSRTYDRGLHAFGCFSFSLFFDFLAGKYLTPGGSALYRALFVFLLGGTLGVLFELLEFCRDSRHPDEPQSQKGLRDTDTDLLFNLIGALFAAAYAFFFLYR